MKTNIPGPGSDVDQFAEQYLGCSCDGPCTLSSCSCLEQFGQSYSLDGKLIVDSASKDVCRPILECGSDCGCNILKCTNRVVQVGITSNYNVFNTRFKGFGLQIVGSSDCIPAYTFVCEYAGEVISHDEAKKRVEHNDETNKDNYVIALRENVGEKQMSTYIDPSNIGNLGRFINHSCDPNLVMVPVRVNHPIPRLALFARRDLKSGEELTFDYSGKASFPHCDIIEKCQSLKNEASISNEQKLLNENAEPNAKKPKTDQLCVESDSFDEDEKDKIETNHLKNKLCHCGSKNCQYYLPFDKNLLV